MVKKPNNILKMITIARHASLCKCRLLYALIYAKNHFEKLPTYRYR